MTDSTEELYSVDFEIFGMVQGMYIILHCKYVLTFYFYQVSFSERQDSTHILAMQIKFLQTFQYTQTEASKLGLKGWCKNTNNNTVTGVMQGKQNQVNEMYVLTLK